MTDSVTSAWQAYLEGRKISAEDAAGIHVEAHRLGATDEHLAVVIHLCELLAKEYARGQRCGVCCRTDGGRDCYENC